MTEDKWKKVQQDPSRMHPGERYEVDYLAKQLGVTPQQVRDAEKAVGCMRSKITEYLTKGKKSLKTGR